MSREAVFLNNESYPAINVQITSEELAYSQGGLYRLASVRTEDYFATIRFDLIINCDCDHLLSFHLQMHWSRDSEPGRPLLRAHGPVLAPGVSGQLQVLLRLRTLSSDKSGVSGVLQGQKLVIMEFLVRL